MIAVQLLIVQLSYHPAGVQFHRQCASDRSPLGWCTGWQRSNYAIRISWNSWPLFNRRVFASHFILFLPCFERRWIKCLRNLWFGTRPRLTLFPLWLLNILLPVLSTPFFWPRENRFGRSLRRLFIGRDPFQLIYPYNRDEGIDNVLLAVIKAANFVQKVITGAAAAKPVGGGNGGTGEGTTRRVHFCTGNFWERECG